MRYITAISFALGLATPGYCQEIDPIPQLVPAESVMDSSFIDYAYQYDCYDNMCQWSYNPGYIHYNNNLDKLASFIKKCIVDIYIRKNLSSGYFFGDPRPDSALNGLDGIRIRTIVPSELFRDSSSDWDHFEIVAAVQFDEAKKAAQLWVLPMNYLRRSRGGISFGSGPSPDWEFSGVTDFDTVNGRLRSIQSSVQKQASLALGTDGDPSFPASKE